MPDNPTIKPLTKSCPPDPQPPAIASEPIQPRRFSIWILVATLLLVMVVVLGAYRIIVDHEQTDDATIASEKHAYEVIGVLTRILADADDIETGQRGFLLTGKPAYLEPYGAGLDALRRDLSLIRDLSSTLAL